jgi:hypothetical protein
MRKAKVIALASCNVRRSSAASSTWADALEHFAFVDPSPPYASQSWQQRFNALPLF